MSEEVRKGLYGVVADETAVSKVMPETNSLTYRGYAVQDLAASCSFEEVVWLLWHGELPTQSELAKFTKEERSRRGLAGDLPKVLETFPHTAHPMDAVRTAVSYMGLAGTDNGTQEGLLDKSIGLLAATPTAMAAAARLREGKEPIAPREDLSFSENVFHMRFGEVPEVDIVRCFDISMILYAEHSFNASTFTARTISSSLSDIYSAVTGAIGSLKGTLHGGANEAVMHILEEIGEVGAVESWLDKAMAEKRTIMGFGHRVYKHGDSRVPTMTQALHKVAKLRDGQKWVDMEDKLSALFIERKGIHPNLDYPAGPAYYLMGFPIDEFTPLFVISRMSGWTAHIMEQLADNRLVRPLSAYVGQEQREVVPLANR